MNKIITYIKVMPIYHTATILGAAVGIYSVLGAIEDYCQGNIKFGVARTIIALFNLGICIPEQIEAALGFKEYKKVKAALKNHGWDKRIIKVKSHSWCQRNLTQIASDESGFGKETKDYLHEKGYRWYHFFRDYDYAYLKKNKNNIFI